MTQTPDGWRALENERLLQDRKLFDIIVKNEMVRELWKLGYNAEYINRDIHIEGVSLAVKDALSTRTEQLNEAAKALRGEYPSAPEWQIKQMACLGTREAKEHLEMSDLKAAWDKKLEALGTSLTEIYYRCMDAGEKRNDLTGKLDPYTGIEVSINAAHDVQSVFSKKDVIINATEFAKGAYTLKDITKAFNDFVMAGSIVCVDEYNNLYTTPEMIEIEQWIIEQIHQSKDSMNPAFTRNEVEALVQEKYSDLTEGQKEALKHILTTKDRISGIQGNAGTGKTFMLNAAREQFEEKGYNVIGLAVTGKAASEMANGAGIMSQTVTSFLINEENTGMDEHGNNIIFIDEASMLGSKQFYSILNKIKDFDAKMFLVGDVKQLQAISAGAVFEQAQKHDMTTVHMTDVVRQTNPDYLDVVNKLAENKIDDAIKVMNEKNMIHENKTSEEGLQKDLVEDLRKKEDYTKTLVVTSWNRHKDEINKNVREVLKEEGKLQQEDVNIKTLQPKNLFGTSRYAGNSYAVGDHIMTTEPLSVFSGEEFKGTIPAGMTGTVINAPSEEFKFEIGVLFHNERTGETAVCKIDVSQDGDKLAVHTPEYKDFCAGDRITFLKNDKMLNVMNGHTGTIQTIDYNGNMSVKTDDGRIVNIDPDMYPYINHGYAVTTYKSQGQTSKDVIMYSPSSAQSFMSYQNGYTAITRGKDDVKIFTDNIEKFVKGLREFQIKTTTLDYSAGIAAGIEALEKDVDQEIGKENEIETNPLDDNQEPKEESKENTNNEPDPLASALGSLFNGLGLEEFSSENNENHFQEIIDIPDDIRSHRYDQMDNNPISSATDADFGLSQWDATFGNEYHQGNAPDNQTNQKQIDQGDNAPVQDALEQDNPTDALGDNATGQENDKNDSQINVIDDPEKDQGNTPDNDNPLTGTKQCSPNECFVFMEGTEDEDTEEGANDKTDKGFSEDGSCDGEIYIFNGYDYRCREAGYKTLWRNCCKTSSSLDDICNDRERTLATMRANGQCHEIGSYCTKKIKLTGTCIQRVKTFCCFSSQFGCLVQTQGRGQFKNEIFWGSPKAPNCIGMTPSQFEMLDFDKIDLTSLYGSYVPPTYEEIGQQGVQSVNEYYEDHVE
jgi:hypothetical protein